MTKFSRSQEKEDVPILTHPRYRYTQQCNLYVLVLLDCHFIIIFLIVPSPIFIMFKPRCNDGMRLPCEL